MYNEERSRNSNNVLHDFIINKLETSENLWRKLAS